MSIGEWVSWSKFIDCEIGHQECVIPRPFKTLSRTLLEDFLFLLSVEDMQVSDLVDWYQWDDASDLGYQWDDASDLVDWYQWDDASDLIYVDWYQWDDCNCHIYLSVNLPGLLAAQCDCNLEKRGCLLPHCCMRQGEVR